MTKKEISELREVFNQELIKYSDVFYGRCVRDATEENYFVKLTLEMLEFLDLNFENYGVEFVNDYSDVIGEIVYFSFYTINYVNVVRYLFLNLIEYFTNINSFYDFIHVFK